MLCRVLPDGAPKHTMTVLVLAACGALNLLSACDLLWVSHAISDPYMASTDTGGYALAWFAVLGSFEMNVLLSRRSFRAIGDMDGRSDRDARYALSYILATAVVYGLTFLLAESLAG